MARVLWVGDAGRTTGFSRVTHAIAEPLAALGHDVHVLAVGWDAKYAYTGPLKLYRSEAGPARNLLGLDRMVEMVDRVRPDVMVTIEDAPMVLRRLRDNRFDPEQKVLSNVPVISYVPVDAAVVPPSWREINDIATVVAMSRHGARLLDADHVAYHGVDSDTFRPVTPDRPIACRLGVLRTKEECRRAFGISPDAFVVARVDTNTGRKDWGATWRAMTLVDERREAGDPDVWSMWHTKAIEFNAGANLVELMSRGKLSALITNEDDWETEQLVAFLNCADAFVSTSRGEGFGLTILEAMACGLPVVATRAGAIPEVVGNAGITVKGIGLTTNPYGADQVLPDPSGTADALISLMRYSQKREELARRARRRAESFTWVPAIERFDQLIREKAQRPA